MENKIGIISNYIPEEIVEFFGIPYRIIGNFDIKTEPNTPSFTCSFIRDFITAFNSGYLDFLSGIIIPQSCDSLYASFDLLKRKNIFVYRFSTSILNTTDSNKYYSNQIKELINFLEKHFSINFNLNFLREIIKSKNIIRNLLKDIGFLISRDKKDIKYRDFLTLIIKSMQSNSEDSIKILKDKYKDYKLRKKLLEVKNNVMLIGPILDYFDLVDIIEEFENTKIISDCVTNGWRYFDSVIPEDLDPLIAISSYYLSKVHSPTFNNDKYLITVKRALKDFDINRVILINQRGCEPHSFYIPKIRHICKIEGVSFLTLNVEHSESNLERNKMQIQSFLEMI